MQSSDFFIGLFLAIGMMFSVLAYWARGQMRLERKATIGRQRGVPYAEVDLIAGVSLAELDRKIADLTVLRDRFVTRPEALAPIERI